jgi:L-aminopeptidase/D-esterase-like protein
MEVAAAHRHEEASPLNGNANAITDLPGLRIGHASDSEALTGCTVLIAEQGAAAGCDVRGSAPGTRETDLLKPGRLVDRVHAILLTGGSAFGLDAATGVMRFLEERGIGFPVGPARVPIVPGAVIFDLGIGRADRRPDAAMGYAACEDAFRGGAPIRGNVGVGTGASVGKLLGMQGAMKAGLGSHALRLESGVTVAALVAVNAIGNVYDPDTGEWLAGARNPLTGAPLDVERWLLAERGRGNYSGVRDGHAADPGSGHADRGGTPDAGLTPGANTTIGVVATDAPLDKTQCASLAQMAGVGLGRSIFPVHTLVDGDTLFAMSLGGSRSSRADLTILGAVAALAVSRAVADAVRSAAGAGGLPAHRDLHRPKT